MGAPTSSRPRTTRLPPRRWPLRYAPLATRIRASYLAGLDLPLNSFLAGLKAAENERYHPFLNRYSKRIQQGYGVIHPKNYHLDGQAANCHLNALILSEWDKVRFHVCR